MASPDRPELDRRHAGAQERDGVRAPSRPTLVTSSGECGDAASQSART